jgi:hypothetical protein
MHTDMGNLRWGPICAALKALVATFQLVTVMSLVVAASLVLALLINGFLHRDE